MTSRAREVASAVSCSALPVPAVLGGKASHGGESSRSSKAVHGPHP
jgi:hypothetical protein